MEHICQSCAMPLADDVLGTNADGTKNPEYCHYCFKDGAFTGEETLDQMIETCIPYTLEAKAYPDADTARAAMKEFFPKLKRWA